MYEAPTAQVSKPDLSQKEVVQLIECLLQHYLFQGIPYEYNLRLIKRAMLYSIGPGELVVEEGTPASYLYILAEGSLEVSVNSEVIRELNPVSCFGELVLVLSSSRMATVRTITASKLYVIERRSFEIMMDEITEINFKGLHDFVRTIPLFASIEGIYTESIVRTCLFLRYGKGQVICKEGEDGYLMYVVKTGEVQATKSNIAIGAFKKGSFFGEQALLYDFPNSATFVATEECELVAFSKEQLEAIMPRISKPILYKNVLKQAFYKSQTLRRIPETQLETVLNKFTVKTYLPGDTLVTKGTLIGSLLIVVLKGSLKVKDLTYGILDCIGDSSLRKHVQFPFDADVVATEEVCTGEISLLRFEKALGGSLTQKKFDLWSFFSTIPILSDLETEKMSQLINVSTMQSVNRYEYLEGEFIFMKGDAGAYIYFIEEGGVSIYIDSNVVIRFGPREFFGERACITNTIRNASASANLPTIIWALSRADLFSILGKGRLHQLKSRIRFQSMREVKLSQLIPVRLVLSKETFTAFIVTSVDESYTSHAYLKAYHLSYLKERQEHYEFLKSRSLLSLEVDHPMIIRYIKAFKSSRCLMLLYQYVIGTNMQTLLAQARKFPEEQVKDIVGQILIILDYLHTRKIALRSFGPESFLISSHGNVYLEDIKCAKSIEGRTYTLVGDPHYCSPEVLSTRGYGLEADLWVLGVLAFKLYYGKYPFGNDAEQPIEIYQSILDGDLRFPRRVMTSNSCGHFVKSLLKSSLEDRCKTINDAKDHSWLVGTLWVRSKQHEDRVHKNSSREALHSITDRTLEPSAKLTAMLNGLSEEAVTWNWADDF